MPTPAPMAATATPIHTTSELVTPPMGVLDWAFDGAVAVISKAQTATLAKMLRCDALISDLLVYWCVYLGRPFGSLADTAMRGAGGTLPTRRPRRAGARTIRLRSTLPQKLSSDRHSALQGEDQVLGVQLKLLELDFLDLLLCGEIRLLQQLFQPLSVMTMFGLQAIYFCAQRGILYFIHPAPPFIKEHLHISPSQCKPQAKKEPEVTSGCGIRRGKPPCVTAITTCSVRRAESDFGQPEARGTHSRRHIRIASSTGSW